MKIIIDVMSGDNAPGELLRGAVLAREEYGEDITVVGDERIIRRTADTLGLDISDITVVHAPGVVTMDDRAVSVMREKSDSSMAIGLHMLAAGEGDAFVSAGNTGALLAGATLIVRRIKGIERAGIATILPFPNPILLMDSGANIEVTPSNLEQFAFMGSKYMEKVFGIASPRVGLLNIGAEESKGRDLERNAYLQFKSADVNFVGNIEARNVPQGQCDVLVTDGFTGNILLKYTEGMGKFMLGMMKDLFTANLITKISAASMKGRLTDLKKSFDAAEYGGAPLLGIAMPVIKAHGSSDALAIKNAIRQAIGFSETDINREIAVFAMEYETKMREREAIISGEKKAKRREDKIERRELDRTDKAKRTGNPSPHPRITFSVNGKRK